MTYQLNFDEFGRWVWAGNKKDDTTDTKMAKVSKASLQRTTRGVSSVWRSCNSNEHTCNVLTCKFLVLVSAGGYLAPTCIHFHGFDEDELGEDFVVIEVPGLEPGGDMCYSEKRGYVIFSRRKAQHSDSDKKFSIHEVIMDWYHREI